MELGDSSGWKTQGLAWGVSPPPFSRPLSQIHWGEEQL